MLKFFICLCLLFTTMNCSRISESSNNELIEKLNSQIKTENYEQIYNELSDSAKRLTPKEEFLERINKATKIMKEVDNSLNFKKDKNVRLSNEMSDLYFEYQKN